MTQEQINELRKLAQAATHGKWEYTHGGRGDNGKFIITEYFVILEDDNVAIAADIVDPKTSRPSKANAAYIAAANPAVIIAMIQQRDELLAALNSAASVSHSGGLCGYAEDDALRLVRVITLPYWDKSASDDKHREAIAKAEAQS